MPKRSKHFVGTDKNLHNPVENSTEGGACLTGHVGTLKPLSCSYRWQALVESRRSRQAIYNKEPKIRPKHLREGSVPTSAYVSKRGKMTPLHHAFKVSIPQPGDWYINGPVRADVRGSNGKPIRPGKNFTKDCWPYWHNSHHLIPKMLFLNTIEAVEEFECRDLIRQALLRAQYNINHHINMIILPQDMEVARSLGLPRHLIMEDGPDGLDRTPKFDHVSYTENVNTGLEPIIAAYKRACDNELEKECDTSSFRLSKQQLEELSKQCYASVLAHGEAHPGAAISTMPPIVVE